MNKRKQLSNTDIDILNALSVNPFAKNEVIGEAVHAATKTVEGRLKALREAGYVTKEQRLPDLAKAGVMLRYRVDISINPRALKKSCEEGPLKALADRTTNPQQRLAW